MFMRGGAETRMVRVSAAPGMDWEVNLAEFWERPGQNINVGVRLTCTGPCPAYVASYFGPLSRGVSATVYPVLFECEP
jgi:hypothetical protein